MLVEGIAATGNTKESTKKILHARYGDTNRTIEAHLDFLKAYIRQHLPRPTR